MVYHQCGFFHVFDIIFLQILVEKHCPVHLFSTVAFVFPSVFDAEQHGMDTFLEIMGWLHLQQTQPDVLCLCSLQSVDVANPSGCSFLK